MAEHPGFRITCEDLATGQSSTVTIAEGDFMLIPTGACYLASTQRYEKSGTTVLTLKDHRPLRSTPDSGEPS